MPLPGDVGLVAKAVEKIAGFFMDEDGFKEVQVRLQLRAKKKDILYEAKRRNWPRVRVLIDEFERMSDRP